MSYRKFLDACITSGQNSFSASLRAVLDKGPGQLKFWLIALLVGIAAGFATILFRLAISELQTRFYGTDDVMLASAARQLHWLWVLCLPIAGGLVVGLILHKFTPDGRVRSVANVIEGAALQNGKIEGKAGLASTIASLITLSTGGSTGREGPAVQLGAIISSKTAKILNADGVQGRDLLGCAVAAAVSASFNAPIAGAIFALEVVLRHFAMHAFAPITISAVAGTVVSRLTWGNTTEFSLPDHSTEFYIQLPAFVLLGAVCGIVAVVMMRCIFWAEDLGDVVQENTKMPRWLRPAVAGAFLGVIAIFFPHIIGVGYETTSDALTGELVFWTAVVFAVLKVIAVAITMAGRMGGGIFSPALMLGALTGLAFGWVATAIVPSVQGDETLYALAGMGAVAAAVLGAPISTSLIIFEMTGDLQAGLAVLVAVSLSTAVASNMVHRSFFLTQLERKGVHLAAGPQSYLLATFRVEDLMRPLSKLKTSKHRKLWKSVEAGVYLDASTTLEVAMPMFQSGARSSIPVVRTNVETQGTDMLGAIYYVDALAEFNKALSETAREEHS